jgi:hypothetical protein
MPKFENAEAAYDMTDHFGIPEKKRFEWPIFGDAVPLICWTPGCQ